MVKCRKGFREKNGKCIRRVKISQDKTTNGFDISLTLFSLFGFLVIILAVFTGFDLSPWVVTVLLILTGTAFLYEGQIQNLRKILRDGVQKIEIPLLLTLVIGLAVIIAGILSIPSLGISSRALELFVGFMAIFAAIVIILQTWIFK